MHDPIAARYAQALFEAAKAEGELEEMRAQLLVIQPLLHGSPDLRRLMCNPDVAPEDKAEIFERILKRHGPTLLGAFIRMAVSLGRADRLPAIAEAFQTLVDEEQGRLRVVVRSARELPATVLDRLRAKLEQQEGKRVELKAEVALELLGGLQVHLDHRVIDGSVQGQLAELRRRLTSARVR